MPIKTHDKPHTISPSQQIVPPGKQNLALRSAALVTRGLRDLARESNWIVKKVCAGQITRRSISATGTVTAIASSGEGRAPRLVLYDIETSTPKFVLSVEGEKLAVAEKPHSAFAWSLAGRHLVAAWGAWEPALHLFDLNSRAVAGIFGKFTHFPFALTWSERGNYFASASSGGQESSLRLWAVSADAPAFKIKACGEVRVHEGLEKQAYESEVSGGGEFAGYGQTAFSPDEKIVASVVEIRGEWADDSIVLADVPGIRNQIVFQVQGHISDISWTPDSNRILYCAAGQAFRLDVATMNFQPLPFGAELCACHPHLPLCLCYSSWQKNSAKGTLFLVDLNRNEVFDEYAAEGIADLRWNVDGTIAYGMTGDGMAFIYEQTLI
jgi:WD40 repeat protein